MLNIHSFKPHLETTYVIHLLKDQQISWNSFKIETLRSYWYFTKHISVFDSALPAQLYGIAVCMGPSCSNKAGQIIYLTGKFSSFNSFFSIQISCDPVIQLNKNFQYRKSVCTIMHELSNNSLPANNLFLYSTQVHSFNSRFSETGGLNIKSNQIWFWLIKPQWF